MAEKKGKRTCLPCVTSLKGMKQILLLDIGLYNGIQNKLMHYARQTNLDGAFNANMANMLVKQWI